ncbi:hypothetical protein B0H10DRAFT_2042333 [Mycena sp. CBHHK59/15]|nr:hypothetical protein B0H10DRAFT_2042333 [Mycena sp. CBHHK59/15]
MSTTAPTTSFRPQFSGSPTSTRHRETSTFTSPPTRSLSPDISGYRYYVVAAILFMVVIGVLAWLRWRYNQRRQLRQAGPTSPVLQQSKPEFFDAYLDPGAKDDARREKDWQWEDMTPLSVSTIGTTPWTPTLLDSTPRQDKHPPKGHDASSFNVLVAVIVAMPSAAAAAVTSEDDLQVPYLNIGVMNLNVLH